MINPDKLSKLSVDEYLALEETASVKHEFVNGQIFAMTGASMGHNVIALNIATLLKSHLKDKGCTVFIADMKVNVETANCFYYPDVVVDCGVFEKANVCSNTPVTIFEVLSKSTSATDRREKLVNYQLLATLKHYVIVHQSRKRLEVYRRVEDGWTIQEIGSNDVLELEICPGDPIVISMSDIYADLEFDEGPDLQVREDVEVYIW